MIIYSQVLYGTHIFSHFLIPSTMKNFAVAYMHCRKKKKKNMLFNIQILCYVWDTYPSDNNFVVLYAESRSIL